jgi:MOSC domain-containing protein YiiM
MGWSRRAREHCAAVSCSGIVAQVSTSRGGVPKYALTHAELTAAGLVGDAWKHPNIHGGPLQAVLLITEEGIDELVQAGFPLYSGALGENITTRGIDRRSFRSGQRFEIGPAVIELTKRRTPCRTLNVYGRGIQHAMFDRRCKDGDSSSPLWGLSGFYASVLTPGTIYAGDAIRACPNTLN